MTLLFAVTIRTTINFPTTSNIIISSVIFIGVIFTLYKFTKGTKGQSSKERDEPVKDDY